LARPVPEQHSFDPHQLDGDRCLTSDEIKLTVLPTEAMHADLTWLPINPANMATKDQPVKQKDWVEVPHPCRPAAIRA
jgi:hypothetical protein